MSYVFEDTTVDEFILMVAAEDGRTPPEPSDDHSRGTYGTLEGQPMRQAQGFCYLNRTDNMMIAYRLNYFYESPRHFHVIHLTWAGWDRVKELMKSGMTIPTDEELRAYGREAGAALSLLTNDPRQSKKLYRPGTEAWYEQQPEDRPPKPSLLRRLMKRQPA